MTSPTNELIVLAVGGNALIADPKHVTVQDQYAKCLETCKHITALLAQGYRVVVTHGNGPQIGYILRRSELASHELHLVPFDSASADTQGAIGYQIQQALRNIMHAWEKPVPTATVITQVLVDCNDPSFQKPSKPIGSFMDQETAELRRQQEGWTVAEDAGRGFRRVVPSPKPLRIVEIDAIRSLSAAGFAVVAVGGGGIPVVQQADGTLIGTAAVIDKDRASSLLAQELGADMLVIATAVEKVLLNFGKPNAQAVDQMTVADCQRYIKEGHFAPGSMLPKIEAAMEYVQAGGRLALITDPEHLTSALAGETGTRIVP